MLTLSKGKEVNNLNTHNASDLEIEAVEGFIVEVQTYLHEVMEAKSISRSELAERMGVSRARISQMFGEKSNITVRMLARIAHHLGEEPVVASETTTRMEKEREAKRRGRAVTASRNVIGLWKDTSKSNPADVVCGDDDSRLDGIVKMARRARAA